MTAISRARAWLALFGLLVSLGGGPAEAAPAPPAIDLATAGDTVPLTGALWLFKEAPDEPRTPAELLGSGTWERTSTENLSSAYRPATVWLLGTVHNSGKDPLARWLVILPWQLRDVQLFVIDPDTGEPLTHERAGLGNPRSALAVDPVHPTFPITLAPGQTRTLLLRVQDRSFLGLTVLSVDPQTYAAREAKHRDLYLVFAGFVLAIMVVLLLWGDWRFTLASAWLGAIVLFELSYEMPLLLSLWPGLRPHMVSIFTITGALTIAVFALASLVFLELYRHRLWRTLYGLLIGVILVAAFATPLTDETQLTRWVAVRTSLVIALLWPLSALFAPVRKGPYQWGVLLLLGGCWLEIVVRILTSTGLLPRIHDDTLVMTYRLAPLGLILGVIVLDRLGRRQAERSRERELLASREAARQALLEMQQQENIRLTTAVAEQTRALREATARAEEGSQAKSALLSMVSHELRAPLHDILGYAQLLARQVPPQARDQLAIIQDSGNQLLHLINDILTFSRGEVKPIALDPAPLSLSRLATHLGEVYRPLAARGDNALRVRVESGPADWVMGDEQRLTQVLRNLLENACKFTQGGQIELDITVTAAPPPGADALPGAAGPDCLVALRVTDTGIGIPEAEQASIFQPFKRLDRYQRVPGLGLGLAIAQQLATAMGGQIRVLSRQGLDHGTTFSLELPLPCCQPQDKPSEAELPPLGYRGRQRTLLIADDFPTSRQFLADCCEGWGFRVLLASDGNEALALFRAAEPPVDAALVDQFMPHLDGWGFLRAVRDTERGQALPVVLISAAPRQRPDGLPAALDVDRFAMKPLSESQLARILGEVLGLTWDYGEDSPPTVAPVTWSAAQRPPCTTEELSHFRDMVALGQLMAIRQWALEMADRHPPQETVWQDILQLCTSVDLPGLQRLAVAWSSAPGDPDPPPPSATPAGPERTARVDRMGMADRPAGIRPTSG